MFDVMLSTHEFAGRGVVALTGKLDVTDAPGVASHLTTAAAVYGPWLILDLAGLDYIDSASLGVLVRVLKRTRARGGDLLLAGPQGVVDKVLTATGLIDVFSVFPSVAQAVLAAGQTRALSPAAR